MSSHVQPFDPRVRIMVQFHDQMLTLRLLQYVVQFHWLQSNEPKKSRALHLLQVLQNHTQNHSHMLHV